MEIFGFSIALLSLVLAVMTRKNGRWMKETLNKQTEAINSIKDLIVEESRLTRDSIKVLVTEESKLIRDSIKDLIVEESRLTRELIAKIIK